LDLKNQTKKLSGLWKISQSANWLLPYQDICFISERHNICELKDQKLHCSTGPAIQYPDFWSIYALNGVRVTKEIVETPAEQLDPNLILTEKNAEIRREIVRKIGVERICQKLQTKTRDKWNGYELLELPIPEMETKAVYLKMRNPSIGTYHLEGIPPEITTCQQALRWRTGGLEWSPSQLT